MRSHTARSLRWAWRYAFALFLACLLPAFCPAAWADDETGDEEVVVDEEEEAQDDAAEPQDDEDDDRDDQDEDGDEDGRDTHATTDTDGDNAIARGMAFGVSGNAALGTAQNTQSPGGFQVTFFYPTTQRSHLRVKAGIPLFFNRNLETVSGTKYPDPMLSVENEWGWRYFALGVGAWYSYLSGFSIDTSEYGRVSYRVHYSNAHTGGVVFGIRAGKPNAGFYGRFAWPFPFMFYDDEPNNFLLDYSAFGVFGTRTTKFGVGIVGTYKRRDADYVSDNGARYDWIDNNNYVYDGTATNYRDYGNTEYNEYFAMIPAFRAARMVGERLVLGLSIELGGTIVPRFFDLSGDWWKPYVGLDVVYSLGTIKGPNVMDGTF